MIEGRGDSCYHCGTEIISEIHFDEKAFCCAGCKSVYQILTENNMDAFYQMEQAPGTRQNAILEEKYKFLELEDVQETILDFSEGDINKFKVYLPQIHCSSCIWLLEHINQLNEHIISSQINFIKKEAVISYHNKNTSLREVAELLEKIGYPPNFSLQNTTVSIYKEANKKLVQKLALAGFVFGNIMLLSFPEYLGISVSKHADWQHIFGYINLGLSIPLMLFSSTEYLISAYKGIRSKYINIDVPISIGILVLFIRSAYEILSLSGAGYMDSLAGLLFFLLLGKWFQNKTYQSISFERDYKSYFPIAVTKMENGKERSIALEQLEVGDQLIIRNQELIPADGILISNEANIDYSFVTGEEVPIRKEKGDKIFAGGRQLGDVISVKIEKKVENSYLTQLWNQKTFDKDHQQSIVTLSDNISKHFTAIILSIALIAGVVWFFIDPSRIMNVVTAILIVACPCALALSIPFTFGNGIRVLGKLKFYLKNASVIEQMAKVNTLVFDKTGTLSTNKSVEIEFIGIALTSTELLNISSIIRNSSHPLSKQLYDHLNIDHYVSINEFEEHPGLGIEANINKDLYKIGSASFTKADKLISLPYTKVVIKKNSTILGYYRIKNAYRANLNLTLQTLKQKYDIHLLSGDNNHEQSVLEKMFGRIQMFFNQDPKNKLDYIKKLQEKDEQVMMFGDGLNDAGALKQSNVGIAVSEDIYAFSPSCDGIIEGNSLNKIDRFLQFSQYNLKVVKYSFIISFLYNVVGLYFATTGQLTPLVAAILMPLSSITVVIFVTLMINGYAKRKLSD